MKILYLTMNPNLGASARVLLDWLRLSSGTDIEASVTIRQEGDLGRWLRRERVDYCVNPMPWFHRSLPWHSLYHAWRLACWARRRGIQIVHCHEHNVYPFATLLRRFLRVPLLCYVHFYIERNFATWAFGGRRRSPDALVWTSEQQRADCRLSVEGVVPNDRQLVIPLGLDPQSFGAMVDQRQILRRQWGIGPDEVVIGAASALRDRKRIDDFLDLIERLQQRHERVFGVLAGGAVPGEEAYAEGLRPRLKALQARGRFRWVGHLEPVEPFLHAIDVFISTSDYETFGMSVCEAMTCRRPVAAYRGGSVHEVAGDGGLIVPDRDLDALTDAVGRLVENEDLRSTLGERGRRRVEQFFTPERSLAQLHALYTSLLTADGSDTFPVHESLTGAAS
jgi:glycosyltransferase involved in cell wall biosynthesis